jgi:hypothetical protein
VEHSPVSWSPMTQSMNHGGTAARGDDGVHLVLLEHGVDAFGACQPGGG